MMIELNKLGWDSFFEDQLTNEEKVDSAKTVIARIVEPARGMSRAVCRLGEVWAESADKKSDVPAVGDWVIGSVRSAGVNEIRLTINRILQRKNKLSRSAPGGKNFEQVICANVDRAFYVIALNQGFNAASSERYLSLITESEIPITIVITKVDAGSESKQIVASMTALAPETPLHLVSVKENLNVDSLQSYFQGSKTIVLLGASGAGKSTIVNYLIDAKVQKVEEVRDKDQKGRHTTTARRLYSLPQGGMVIDSPGIREIQKWEGLEPEPESNKPNKKIKSFKNSRSRRSQEED